MSETARTITYLIVAAVSVAVAWFATPPVDVTPSQLANAKLGQPFFPDFDDPNEPTSIQVVTYDEPSAISRMFAVEFKNGLWTIPSHHNYPADGAQRLAKTANSTRGIKREELRSTSKEDHEALGVVDPLDDDGSRLKGRGQRITLRKGETPVVDLIIGKQVRDRPGYYYVRLPSEDSTYVAKLDIDLSTKFADWVETDLLKLNRDQLTEMVIDNYAISSEGGRTRVVEGEVNRLERAKAGDPWKLEGIDEKTEELDTTKITAMETTLDDLKLVGVRPKPKGLRADLTIDPEFVKNQLELQVLLGDMRARGFEVGPDRDDPKQPRLYSRSGELNVATNEGVVYVLRFGDIFSGDESEIETGIEADRKKAEESKEKENGKAKDGKEEKDGDDAKSKGTQSSRYLFVSTHFDETYIGKPPAEPQPPAGLPPEEAAKLVKEKPSKPKIQPGASKETPSQEEEDTKEEKTETSDESSVESTSEPAEKKVEECGPAPRAADGDAAESSDQTGNETPAEDPADDNAANDKPTDDKPSAVQSPEQKPADQKPADSKPAEAKQRSIDELKKEYETLRTKYDADLKAYEDKIEAGKKRVDELNLRFGDWYYVISADNFSKLHLSRNELVKAKGQPAADKPAAEKPAADKPEADKPEADKPEAGKPEADKPEAGKPEANEPAEQPAASQPEEESSAQESADTPKPAGDPRPDKAGESNDEEQ